MEQGFIDYTSPLGVVDQNMNREKRREGTHVRFRKPRWRNGVKDYWEWRPTQIPPYKRREKRRMKNKLAKASRRANR